MADINNIPDLIYLQVDPEDWIAGDPIPLIEFGDLAEVTWCVDNINNTDIEYLRATPEREAAQPMYDAMIVRQNFEKYSMGESFWPSHWGHAEIARYCKLVIAKEKAALALVKESRSRNGE